MSIKIKKSIRDRISFYGFISPWLLGFLLFSIIPMFTSLYYSFTEITVLGLGRRSPEFIGLDNYRSVLFDDSIFIQSIQNTFVFAFARVFSGVIIALLLAILLNGKIPGKKIYRTMIYLPAIIPVVGSAMLWKQLFSQDFSLYNYLLSFIGIAPIEWLSYDNSMSSVILMSVWSGLGPTMIILLASLQNVPRELLEAAEVDGGNAINKFRHITIPMISPTLVYLLVTGFIGALQAYAEMDLLTGGGPGNITTTMAMNVVNNAFDGRGMGYASAQAWVIFAIILVFSIIFFKIVNKRAYYEGSD
jgi:multiple sugar transport system permease protein